MGLTTALVSRKIATISGFYRSRKGLVCAGLLGLFLLSVEESSAHGVGFERSDAPTVAARFFYIGGDPMAYAAVKVFSPSDAKAEYQSLFADAEGRVAFVPNESGVWRIVAEDGMGHRSEMELSYQTASTPVGNAAAGKISTDNGADHAGSSEAFSPVTLAWKALLGVSLLLNVALLAQRWSRSKAVKDHAPQ